MRSRAQANGGMGRRVLFCGLVALLLPLAAGLRAESAPRLQLIDSDPGHGAALRPGEPLWLRVRYQGAMPIRILVSGQ